MSKDCTNCDHSFLNKNGQLKCKLKTAFCKWESIIYWVIK